MNPTIRQRRNPVGVWTRSDHFPRVGALTYQGSNNFIGVVDLLSWGADGNTGGTLVDTFTTASISRSSLVNTNIFGGFQSSQNNAGFRTETIDQFSIIPEPSTALLGALGALALLRRRA